VKLPADFSRRLLSLELKQKLTFPPKKKIGGNSSKTFSSIEIRKKYSPLKKKGDFQARNLCTSGLPDGIFVYVPKIRFWYILRGDGMEHF
jgi:hypothetical protein